jgi:hypothetical protein
MLGKVKKLLLGVAALGGAAVGGAAVAAAATSHSSTAASGAQPVAPPARSMPAPGTKAHEDAEKPVTGADAEKAKAAAVKVAGGGTAGDVTTDYFGDGYEVTVTKSDGSSVEIHLDGSFQALAGRPGGGPPTPGA